MGKYLSGVLCIGFGCIPERHALLIDVGHGSGDSLLLQVWHSRVPRPSLLIGITSLSAHHNRSKTRLLAALKHRQAEHSSPLIRAKLFQGDAIYYETSKSSSESESDVHPLSPDSPFTFDTVLALDCAYHFRTRARFLQQSYAKLAPGGRIALADIYFSTSSPSSSRPSQLMTFILSSLRVMPCDNVITKEEYIAEMKRIGYVEVEVEDITEYVFPGFVKFLSGRGGAWKAFVSVMAWLQRRGARFGIVAGMKSHA